MPTTIGHLPIQLRLMAVVVVKNESSGVGLLTAVSKVNCGSKKVRVHKYRLHPGLNAIASPGTSKLLYMDWQDGKLYGWILETEGLQQDEYEVYVAITGEEVPHEYHWCCTAQLATAGGYWVVHGFD